MTISEFDALKILKLIKFPIYKNGKVHFKDVYKKVVKHILIKKDKDNKQGDSDYEDDDDDGADFKLGHKIKARLQKEWKGKYKNLKRAQKDKTNDATQIMALGIIRRFIQRNRQKMRILNKGKLGSSLTSRGGSQRASRVKAQDRIDKGEF